MLPAMAGMPVAYASTAQTDIPSLKEVYREDFLVGCAFSERDLSGARLSLIRSQFNVLTMENAMKPDALRNAAGGFTFGLADSMIASIGRDGLPLHGHTLVWHQQSPAWLNRDEQGGILARAEAERNLAGHIESVAGHFAGKVISWDVVNEAVMDNPPNPRDWRASLRQTDWLNAFANGAGQSGADYVERAFLLAREADPAAKLYYNDYNLDGQAKAIAVAAMVKEINDRYIARGNTRLLIEGIGMQAHYHIRTKPEDVEASLKRFVALGVEVSISELDVFVTGAAETLTPAQEKMQAELYARLFLVFRKYAAHIERVTFWGLDNGSSWRKKQFPLLFDASLAPKEAFRAVTDPEGYLGIALETPAVSAQNTEAPANTPASASGENLPAEAPARSTGFPWWAAAAVAGIAAGIAACLLIRRRKKAG